MADGYARATGEVGVVLVTSGPGATNVITGIATAYMDSIPMVVLSGQVMSSLIGYDSFQECDMVGISRPMVKHSFMVKWVEDIPTIMKKAFWLATSGRPGPVVVDLPKDMMCVRCCCRTLSAASARGCACSTTAHYSICCPARRCAAQKPTSPARSLMAWRR